MLLVASLASMIAAMTTFGAAAAAQGAARPISGERPWIMVDDDGRAAPDDCESARRAYRRIEDALDDARPGDRISVCPGRYRESLDIGRHSSDVYLAAEVSFEAVLAPPPTDDLPAVDVHDVTRFEMRGFRIRPAGRIGPVTIGGLRIPGTTVCSPAPVAIRIDDSTDVTIRGDRVWAGPACGYRIGIDIAQSSVQVSGVEVTDFLGRGIVAGRGADIAVDHSDVRFLHPDRSGALPGATLDAEATGMVLDGVDGARLRTVHVFTRVPTDPDELPSLLWAGIIIQDARGPVVIRGDSVVTRTWRYGIRVLRSDAVTILNTLVRRTYGDGLLPGPGQRSTPHRRRYRPERHWYPPRPRHARRPHRPSASHSQRRDRLRGRVGRRGHGWHRQHVAPRQRPVERATWDMSAGRVTVAVQPRMPPIRFGASQRSASSTDQPLRRA